MKNYMKLAIVLLGMLVAGCSKTENTEEIDEKYLRCNETSFGTMSEVEDGYFYLDEDILFYADKNNLDTWVPVCNKPNCTHNNADSCNAYIPSLDRLIQKNGKFYGIDYEVSEGLYIYEMDTTGNGTKKVYTIPLTERIIGNIGYARATFSDRIVVSYKAFNEKGFSQRYVISLEEDENGEVVTRTLWEDNSENMIVVQGNGYWKIRGEKDVLMTTLLLEEGEDYTLFYKNLVSVEDELKKVNLPSDVSLLGGYLSNDSFKCYEKNEGFYEINLNTGEKTLIYPSQIEDAQGYTLSEEYMIECNRYINHKPEEAYLKFYNGEEWIDIALPEEVKNSDDPFYPVAVASDRIFYNHNIHRGNDLVANLYYFMLEEESPELIYCGEVGLNVEEETTTENESLKQ